MKFFKVYKKPRTPLEESIFVETGFSWKNSLFGIFWALYKKLWDLALIHLLFISVVMFLINSFPVCAIETFIVAIAIQIILSFYIGTFFFKRKLVNQGYKEVDLVAAASCEEAFLRFLSATKKVDNG